MAERPIIQERPTESPGVTRAGPIIVGVGASAGGLKALQQFVEAIPADSGMAYVVILHLDPDRESRMAELLQDRTSVPVTQITEATDVQANHVYVVPPSLDIEMRGSTIGMRERSERSERVPIDLFFRTLVDVAGADAIGVILSGTGSDGTEGIRAIRAAGGITIVQSPEEAEYTGMPASAIATGLVDLILPASRIPAELVRLQREPQPLSDEATQGRDVEAELAPIFAALRTRTGHDFSMYKRSTVLRRIGRRLLFNGLTTLPEYLLLLRANGGEAASLRRDLLISVSAFFRDADEFDALAAAVPALFEGKDSKDTVRVWVVGCATGEEVYSIAMVLAEHAATLPDPPRIQMFATDIDEKGYATGREGLYPAAAVARIRPDRLQRFFVKEPGGYRVAKALRELVLFAIHDALRDPPFGRMDLVSCRNLFIYLQPEAQRQVLETFHYALNPLGMLFLGAAESAGDGALFRPMNSGAHRLFARSTLLRRAMPRLAAADPPRWSVRGSGSAPVDGAPPFSYGALHTHLLEEYGPPSVVVDERWEVVHLSDSAGRFLRVAGGEPSHRLLDLARPELRSALRTSVHQAFELGQPTSRVVRTHGDGGEPEVTIEVRPSGARGAAAGSRFALITFEESRPKPEASAPRPSTDPHDVSELEEQLGQMREQLESARTDHDHSVAELQTANEELLSINEEQKAAVEELETGREEIQAINEELTTINQEHQSTIEELKRTNADVQNLIESTEIGTIFVDLQLRIRRYTPPVTDVFNFVPSDVGRPLRDITHRLDYPDLIVDATAVLGSLQRHEREVASGNEWFIVRINPYRSHDGRADGAVLTFFNHTARHRLEEELRQATIVAKAANAAKDRFLSTLSHELRTPLSAIMGYAEILGLDAPLTAEQMKRVERIKAGGRHLDAMIGQLLDFSRLDSNQLSVEANALDARTIVHDVHLLMYPLADRKQVALTVDVPATAIPLTTDADKARQVLMNLCGNAVKYTAAGHIHLGVREADGRVVFEVSDTGPGIAPEHHVLIFDRFWQVDGGSTRMDSGLGIGLAAAREYGRLLGGDVEVESQLGEGSTFRFWLPRPEHLMPDPEAAVALALPALPAQPAPSLARRPHPAPASESADARDQAAQ